MEYSKLMAALDGCFDDKTAIIIQWDDGCIIKSLENTGAFESDNCCEAEPGDENYREYYECGVRVDEIIAGADTPKGKLAAEALCSAPDNYMEITDADAPLKIEAEDGTLFWHRDRDIGPWVRPEQETSE